MLTRFWQTVQLLTLVRSPAPVHQTVLPARSLAMVTAWGLPHLIAIAAFTAACQCGSSSRWRTLLLVALPVAIVARMAGVLCTSSWNASCPSPLHLVACMKLPDLDAPVCWASTWPALSCNNIAQLHMLRALRNTSLTHEAPVSLHAQGQCSSPAAHWP